jgi:hypothetical protein
MVVSVESIEVPIPWQLKQDELRLDPATAGVSAMALKNQLTDLIQSIEHPGGMDPEDIVVSVLYGAVALHVKSGEPMARCLDTAMVWCFG